MVAALLFPPAAPHKPAVSPLVAVCGIEMGMAAPGPQGTLVPATGLEHCTNWVSPIEHTKKVLCLTAVTALAPGQLVGAAARCTSACVQFVTVCRDSGGLRCSAHLTTSEDSTDSYQGRYCSVVVIDPPALTADAAGSPPVPVA